MKTIAISGTIGAGKTTLLKSCESRLGLKVMEEPVLGNPFLHDYYENPETYSFHSQISALTASALHFQQQQDSLLVCDRHLNENVIFASLQHDMGYMSRPEFGVYQDLFNLLKAPKPHLTIYLQVTPETSIARVKKRNRFEGSEVDETYLTDLCHAYDQWAHDHQGPQLITLDWNGEDNLFERTDNALKIIKEHTI